MNRIPLLTAVAWLATLLRAGAADFAEGLRHDFHQGLPFAGLLQPVGTNPQQTIRVDVRGVRITLSETAQGPPTPTGFQSQLIIEGDFEITLSYEIVKVDRALSGDGAGVSLFIRSEARTESATFAALLPPSGDMWYVTGWRVAAGQEDEGGKSRVSPATEDARKGRLQLAREGKTLRFLAATDRETTFRELRSAAFGDAPLTLVRLAADPGGTRGALEAVFRDFEIKANRLGTASERLERQHGSASRWAATGAVLLAAGFGVFLWRNARRRPRANA